MIAHRVDGNDWVIVGGESGPGARAMQEGWVEDIRIQCAARGVPFFVKQLSDVNKKKGGRLLHGRTFDAMPSRDARRARPAPHGAAPEARAHWYGQTD